MANNSHTEISVDEIIASLSRTSLPTIIVEGNDDIIVYRALEEKLAHIGVSMFPVGGRGKVLDIFLRRGEIPLSVRLAFVADKDVWVNTGIPNEFDNARLIFTDGYSIENDVFIDGELWKLLSGAAAHQFETELREFVEWYALALSRHLVDASEPISLHPDHVLNPAERRHLLAIRDQEQYPAELRNEILAAYRRMLRGKSLISLLVRNTNSRGRAPRHTDKGLMESVAIRPGTLLNRISYKIEEIITG